MRLWHWLIDNLWLRLLVLEWVLLKNAKEKIQLKVALESVPQVLNHWAGLVHEMVEEPHVLVQCCYYLCYQMALEHFQMQQKRQPDIGCFL